MQSNYPYKKIKSNNHNSFLDYLSQNKFYNAIHDRVFGFCCSNRDYVLSKVSGYDVRKIGGLEQENMELKFTSVHIDSKENNKIDFDITVNVNMDVLGYSGSKKIEDNYMASFYVLVCCSGSIECDLCNFKIINVEEYSQTKQKKPMSGELVPIIAKSEYDKYAKEILEKYYPEALEKPTKIDTSILASRMGLSICNFSISDSMNIYGQFYFDDTVVDLYDRKEGNYKKYNVKKNTIIVDTEAVSQRAINCRNMTIAHECIHACLHRKAFNFARMLNSNLTYIQCQVDGKIKGFDNSSNIQWMEIHANAIAPCILMPFDTFKKYADELFEKYHLSSECLYLNYIEKIIEELAEFFGVTIYAARKRLIEIGYDEAYGAFNWVDGKYIRPYKFKKGTLQPNETFTISNDDFVCKILDDSNNNFDILMGKYVFVENHLCIDDDKYLDFDENGNLILSDYALFNLDECCVKFKIKNLDSGTKAMNFGLSCYLCRDDSKYIDYDLEMSNSNFTSSNDWLQKYQAHNLNVNEIMQEISYKPFGYVISYLMKYLDINENELADEAGVSTETIRRYKNKPNHNYQKRVVVAIMRAFNVPTNISLKALERSGYLLTPGDKDDDALLAILSTMRRSSIDQVNYFLESQNLEPLTKASNL